MPTVLRAGPYAFRFFASDRDEPPHVHVERDECEAKFWIEPRVELVRNAGFARHELRQVERVIWRERDRLLERWHEYFDG